MMRGHLNLPTSNRIRSYANFIDADFLHGSFVSFVPHGGLMAEFCFLALL